MEQQLLAFQGALDAADAAAAALTAANASLAASEARAASEVAAAGGEARRLEGVAARLQDEVAALRDANAALQVRMLAASHIRLCVRWCVCVCVGALGRLLQFEFCILLLYRRPASQLDASHQSTLLPVILQQDAGAAHAEVWESRLDSLRADLRRAELEREAAVDMAAVRVAPEEAEQLRGQLEVGGAVALV